MVARQLSSLQRQLHVERIASWLAARWIVAHPKLAVLEKLSDIGRNHRAHNQHLGHLVAAVVKTMCAPSPGQARDHIASAQLSLAIRRG